MTDEGFGHWLAGFLDGEGSFLINRPSPKSGPRCVLSLSLRVDDEAILREIRDYTGCGVVAGPYNASPGTRGRPFMVWRVYRLDDCLKMVELLDRFPLRAKKARDYAVWRKAVLERQRLGTGPYGRGLGRDWSVMEQLKAELEAGRVFGALAVS